MSVQHYWKTFKAMLLTDLYKYFSKIFWDDFLNKIIWITCSLAISAYIWPHIGVSKTFGYFIALGSIVSCSFWDAWGVTAQFVSDLEANRVVVYYLTLPLPAWLFFVKQMAFYAIRSMIPSFLIIPICKLILWNTFDISQLHIPKFIIIFVLTNIFCATLSLLMTSMVKGMYAIDNVSVRFLFPLWFFGGSQFAWQTLYEVSPIIAYLDLANPLLYAMEGMRGAFLGQQNFLPFWLCVMMLLFFSLFCWYIAYRVLVRRLDCVI